MHHITITEVASEDRAYGKDRMHVRGLVAAIEPPVDLNPEAVSRVVKDGSLDPSKVRDKRPYPFSEALLIGSSDERTVIYARLVGGPAVDK